MKNVDLIKYLAETAGSLLEKAEKVTPETAKDYLDEAEELLLLGASLIAHRPLETELIKEAA